MFGAMPFPNVLNAKQHEAHGFTGRETKQTTLGVLLCLVGKALDSSTTVVPFSSSFDMIC